MLDSSGISASSPWGLPTDQTSYPEFDPAKARQELETDTAETGQSNVELVLSGVASTEDLAVDQQLVEMWRQVHRNENVADLWLYNTPYALIGDNDIRGLNPVRVLAWGNFLPKPWIGASGSTRARPRPLSRPSM